MVIMAVFLGVAFVVSAALPTSDVCCEEFKPLEVTKTKISGPAVVVMGNTGLWDLQITVTNNLVENLEEVEDELDDDEPNLYFPSLSTRSEGDSTTITVFDTSTINDIVVKDVLPGAFTLLDYTQSQGEVVLSVDDTGSTLITWNVGSLASKGKAVLDLAVIAKEFEIPGRYILNSGASVTGVLFSTGEILSDGPTPSILVSVINGTPNESPIAEAGCDQMAFDGNPVYLDGSGSYDPDGVIVKYTWFVDDSRVGSLKSILSYQFPVGVHEVTLVVQDNKGAVDTDTVTITIYEVDAQIPGGIMHGIVRDATTRRGFDPYIQVWNENYAISTWTDMGGNYKIIGLPAGHYQTYCEAPGYQDFFGEVTITENGNVLYNFDMIRE
jgi:hypothetical protein